MGRQEKSMLGCYKVSVVVGIFDFYDIMLRENPLFWCPAKFADLCYCIDYFGNLVEAANIGANTE